MVKWLSPARVVGSSGKRVDSVEASTMMGGHSPHPLQGKGEKNWRPQGLWDPLPQTETLTGLCCVMRLPLSVSFSAESCPFIQGLPSSTSLSC